MKLLCVLSGQVRAAFTDGNVYLIGKDPVPVKNEHVQYAKSLGAMEKDEVDAIRAQIYAEMQANQTDGPSLESTPAAPGAPAPGSETQNQPGTGEQEKTPEQVAAEEAAAIRLEQLKTATIAILNGGDPDSLTSGKPTVAALSAASGLPNVTAAERDAAFVAVSAG